MRVEYEIEYRRDAKPPKRRLGKIPRWKEVTDRLEELVEEGGVMVVHTPRSATTKESHSLRNAIHRVKKKRGITARFSVQASEEGLFVWARRPEE